MKRRTALGGRTAAVLSDRSYEVMGDGSVRRLPDGLHQVLQARARHGKPRAVFEYHELAQVPSIPLGEGRGHGLGAPPRNFLRLRDHVRAAWECLRGRACAVRWYRP